jgi:hypothetical protein
MHHYAKQLGRDLTATFWINSKVDTWGNMSPGDTMPKEGTGPGEEVRMEA